MCSVLFLPVQSAHVFQKFSYSLCRLCLSLSSLITLRCSDSKAFVQFIAFSGSPTAVHRNFLSLMQRHGHSTLEPRLSIPDFVSQLWFFSKAARQNLDGKPGFEANGITLWAYLSEPVVKDSHKRLRSMQHCMFQVTWSHITVTYVLRRGVQKHCT